MLTTTNYGMDCLETEHMLAGSPQIARQKGKKKKKTVLQKNRMMVLSTDSSNGCFCVHIPHSPCYWTLPGQLWHHWCVRGSEENGLKEGRCPASTAARLFVEVRRVARVIQISASHCPKPKIEPLWAEEARQWRTITDPDAELLLS